MLLGALADAGLNINELETKLNEFAHPFKLEVLSTVRSSIECKKVNLDGTCKLDPYDICTAYEPSEETNRLYMQSVICAMEIMGIEYVMCSDMSIADNADGEVIGILEKAGIELLPTCDGLTAPKCADAAFLGAIISEHGPKPNMDILAIGYGAGGNSKDSMDIVTAVIGQFNPEELSLSMCEEENFASIL